MTLTDVLKDFAYLSVLLLIGFELRKRITLFQRYFIPTSLIAGTIGMFFSPSWLGEVSPVYIPFSSGIGQWSGVLVIVVCATMFLSLELNQVGRDGMATTFLAGAAHQGQMVVGLGIAALFGVLGSTLPYQFGYMGVWGFYAGHGNATTVGNIIQDAGLWNDAVGVGVTFATIGILCGVILGMVIINMGAKRGLTHVKMSFADMDEGERTGYIRPENRVSVGNGVTNVSSLDPLAFQLAIVGVVVVIGIVDEDSSHHVQLSSGRRRAGIQYDHRFCDQQNNAERAHRPQADEPHHRNCTGVYDHRCDCHYFPAGVCLLRAAASAHLHLHGAGQPVCLLRAGQALAPG